MNRLLTIITGAVLFGILLGGCGGSGPVRNEVPDFYVPNVSVVTQSPATPAVGQSLVLTVLAQDNQGVPQTSLFYRQINSGAEYTAVAPGATSTGSTLYFTIPAQALATPGVEYYLRSSDGVNTVTTTVTQIFIKYLNISDHTEIGSVRTSSEVFIQAKFVSDGTIETGTVAVPKTGFQFWKPVDATVPVRRVLMQRVSGTDYYKGTIAADLLSTGDWRYFFFAESSYSDGSVVQQEQPIGGAAGTAYFRLSASLGFNNKPIISPYVENESSKLYVNDTVRLNLLINDDGPEPYSYTWMNASGTTLELSEYNVRNPQVKSGIPGSFRYDVVVTDGGGQKSDTASIELKIETPTLSGEIAANLQTLVLTRAASPYTVIGDFTVPSGKLLKIESGVTVRFKNETRLNVLGDLQALGTTDQPIVFTADTSLPYAGYWDGIFIGTADVNLIQPILPTSNIANCLVQYSREGIVLINAESPTISGCTIQNNANQGIYCQDTTVTIHKCVLTDNGNYGVVARRSALNALPLTFTTLSSNTIKRNLIAGIYCERSRIDMARNDVAENKYGAMIVRCQRVAAAGESEVVNIVANKFYDNADGLRIEDSNVVIGGNDIFLNRDNGIIAYTSTAQLAANAAAPATAFWTTVNINGNAIHNNNDDGIQLVNCYSFDPMTYNDFMNTNIWSSHIYNNVISFSGAEGIELIGSSPAINHNVIGNNSGNGILCRPSGTRGSSPFIASTLLQSNARAAVASEGDRLNGGLCQPSIWWTNFISNTLRLIDLRSDPGDDLSEVLDLGSVPFPGVIDADGDGQTETSIVTDTRFCTGGRSYSNFPVPLGAASTATNSAGQPRFGWNVEVGAGFKETNLPWEDPITGTWQLLSDASNPRLGTGSNIFFEKNAAYTSDLINSAQPFNDSAVGAPIAINMTNPDYQVGGLTTPPYNIGVAQSGALIGSVVYLNTMMNANIDLIGLGWKIWPTK